MVPASSAVLIPEILALLGKLTERFDPDDREMKRWMIERFHNPILAELLQDSTITMLRVLNVIGQSEPVNGITISKYSGVPRGSVSKATRRLVAKKLIITEALPNNKKEILFRTTPLGKELYVAHRAFDNQMEMGFVRFLQRYDENELQFMARVLQNFTEASFLDLGKQDEEE
jgi:DNA-binding MarR family transcriptional regulator